MIKSDKSVSKKRFSRIRKNPIKVLLFLVALLVPVIFLLSRGEEDVEQIEEVDSPIVVETLGGETKTSTNLLGKVEENGVITIVAQTAGVVENISLSEGDMVFPGKSIVTLASNYNGSNAPGVQAQIARTQYKSAIETKDDQLSIINEQKRLAELSKDNASELKQISKNSIESTEGLISLNDDILSTLNATLKDLEDTNVGGVNDAAILQTKQAISGATQGQIAVRSQLDQARINSDDEKPPAQLASSQKDLAIKQLDLQVKMLDTNIELARLQSVLAGIQAQSMRPASPVHGRVERIFVTENQVVSPGTPIAVVNSDSLITRVSVEAPLDVVMYLDDSFSSIIKFNGSSVEARPTYISTVPTNGNLFSISYTIEMSYPLGGGTYVDVQIPLLASNNQTSLVPLDALHQTQNRDFVYVIEDGIANFRVVETGNVIGDSVEIISGLEENDVVITSRNVTSGDSVTTQS